MEGCIAGIIPDVNRAANQPPYRTSLLLVLVAFCLPGLAAAALLPDVLLAEAEAALTRRDLPGAATAFTAAAGASEDPALAERATQFTFGTGFDALAEEAVTRWITLAPGNPLPRELRGRLRLRRHAIDEAVVDLGAALGPGEPRRDEVYLALAADLAAEEAPLVTRALARLTALDPLSPGLQLALGTAALRSGDLELALAAGESAAFDDPGWPEPQLLIARALAASGRVDEGLARADALRATAEGPLVELEYARLLADSGRIGEARTTITGLASRFGDRPELSRTLAFMELATGDLDAADQRFDALDDGGADRFEAFYYRARIASQRGDGEAARRLLERITAGPYLLPARLAMAELLLRAGAPDAALDELSVFASDHPAQTFEVLEWRAQVLQALGRPDEALAAYTEALRYKPASVRLLLARGGLLEQQDRVREALADLGKAAALAPGSALAANAYGYTLVSRAGQARKAWPWVRRAFELEPESAAIEDSVGWTLFRLGRQREARSHLEAALARLPDPEIASHLAEVLWSLGEREEATDLLRTAAVAFPDSRPVRETAERLLR